MVSGLTFNADTGIEQIDGEDIENNFILRADQHRRDNVWDFSKIELVGMDYIDDKKGNDSIIGSIGDDSIKGDSHNDTIDCGLGNDTLEGGNDNDLFLGGEGIDYLDGGNGLDTLDGGEAGDIYLARLSFYFCIFCIFQTKNTS